MRTIEWKEPREKVYRAFAELILQGHTETTFEIREEGITTTYTVMEQKEGERLDVTMKNRQMESRFCVTLSGDTTIQLEYTLQAKGAMSTFFTKFFLNEEKMINRYLYLAQQKLKTM